MLTPDQIRQIAEDLDCGFNCFVHKGDHHIISIPDEFRMPDIEMQYWQEEIDKLDADPENYLKIEGMDSRQSFRVMEAFIDTVENKDLQNKLLESLQRPKPFQNFKFDIDRSGPYRQKWFDFKAQKLIEWVKDHLEAEDLA